MRLSIARLSASTFGLACLCTIPAQAQNAAPGGAPAAEQSAPQNGIADIIVTAQRRSESLQKSALTIEVRDAKSLAIGGVTAPNQLTAVLPTLQISTLGPATGVYLRGVGGFPNGALTNSAVPYYLDGVYVARGQSVVSEFYDVERLELVKGPQGTLYGRNATGGAINVLTVRPKLNETSGHMDVEIGNYGNQNGEAAINLPLGNTVALRASGTIVDKGGFTSVGLGDDVHQAGRLKLLWQPNSDVSLLLNGSYGHIGGKGGGAVALNHQIPGWYPWMDASDPRAVAYGQATSLPAILGIPIPGAYRHTQPSDARQDLNFYNVSAQLDWKLGGTTLTIIPAYRESRMRYASPLGFLVEIGYPIPGVGAGPEISKATSVEARLAGDSGKLKWVTGLYYFNEDQSQTLNVNFGLLTHSAAYNVPSTRSYAAFAQGTYSLSQHLRVTAGIRYTSDRRAIFNDLYLVSPVIILGVPAPQAAACAFPAPTQAVCLVEESSGRKTFNNVSWRAGFEADVLDNSLLYGTVSRGFKAGGFNNESALGHIGQAQPFQPEILTSYEAGLKSRFLDNRLQVNISGFYWDYNNHQEPILSYTNVPNVTGQVVLNIGKIQIYGGDLDVVARPWTGGTISGSVEYAHTVYKNFNFDTPIFNAGNLGCPQQDLRNGLSNIDCTGYQVARSPKFAGRVGIDQAIPFGTGSLVANGTVNFASARWIGVDFLPEERVKGYGKIDASLTYRPASNHWFITGFVRNVTNATVYSEAGKDPLSAFIYGIIQPPRTYGARFGFSF